MLLFMCQWNNARETSEVASLFRSSKIFIFYFNKKVFTDSSFSVDIYQVFGGMDGTFCRFSICNKLTIGRMFMRRPSGQILVLASFVIMHHQQPSYKLTAMTNNKIKCLQHLTKHFLSSVTFCPPTVLFRIENDLPTKILLETLSKSSHLNYFSRVMSQ